MILIKNKAALQKMGTAGALLADLFLRLADQVKIGVSTGELDAWIELALRERGLLTKTKGYMGYRHASCISVNDEVVHGVPNFSTILRQGDLIKVDVCASWKGYCADMARCFVVGGLSSASAQMSELIAVAYQALDSGAKKAVVGAYLSDISAEVQRVVEGAGFGVVRDFAGHGIGKTMHEAPEILNYGLAGRGPVLRAGMTFAIEPMITFGNYKVKIDSDGWTARTVDGSLAAHVEDTIAVTDHGPVFLTRQQN